MIKEAERWSIEHTGVGLSETELELVKFLEEKFTPTNTRSPKCVCIRCFKSINGPSYVLDGDLWCIDCSRSYKITSGE